MIRQHLPSSLEAHEPYEGATSHHGLYDEHVAVCDMVQTPVDQLGVEGDSFHAEWNTVATGSLEGWATFSRSRRERYRFPRRTGSC